MKFRMPVKMRLMLLAIRLAYGIGRVWGRIVCTYGGHRWKAVRTNVTRAAWRAHLHTQAGTYSVCQRCGFIFDDFNPDGSPLHHLEAPPPKPPEKP